MYSTILVAFLACLSVLYGSQAEFVYRNNRGPRTQSGRRPAPSAIRITKEDALDIFLANQTAVDMVLQREIAQVRDANFTEATVSCPCQTCADESFTVDEGNDNGDLCYVLYPRDGFRVTQCTSENYLQSCSEAMTCGCGGLCQDSQLTDLDIFAICVRNNPQGDLYDYVDFVVTVPQKCCCSA